MVARPLISVYNDKAESSGASIQLPAVFKAPIRPDIVRFVQQQMSLNRRQPYAVSRKAGELSGIIFPSTIEIVIVLMQLIYSNIFNLIYRTPN